MDCTWGKLARCLHRRKFLVDGGAVESMLVESSAAAGASAWVDETGEKARDTLADPPATAFTTERVAPMTLVPKSPLTVAAPAVAGSARPSARLEAAARKLRRSCVDMCTPLAEAGTSRGHARREGAAPRVANRACGPDHATTVAACATTARRIDVLIVSFG